MPEKPGPRHIRQASWRSCLLWALPGERVQALRDLSLKGLAFQRTQASRIKQKPKKTDTCKQFLLFILQQQLPEAEAPTEAAVNTGVGAMQGKYRKNNTESSFLTEVDDMAPPPKR